MKPSSRRRHHAIAVLLVIATGLFVIGVSAERDEDTHHDEPGAEAVQHDEANETAEGAGVEGFHEGANAAAEAQRNEGDERVLGVDRESPLFVAGGVALSLLLAGFVWRRPDRRLLIAIAAFAAGFAVLDIAELSHQLDEDRIGLAVLAAVLALVHAGIGALAAQQARTRPSAHQEPAPT